MIPRSYLYVPATAGDRLMRVGERGADAVIVDLEDSVVLARKDEGRTAAAALVRAGTVPGELWLRINSGHLGVADVAAVVARGLTGICVPKVESPDTLAAVDTALSRAEADAGLPTGSIAVNPLVESAAGLEALPGIARSSRVRLLQLGEVDLAADLGVLPGPDGTELAYARSMVVVASRAAGLRAPMAAVNPDFRDLDALRAETIMLRRFGFRGRACIHPAQLPVVHDVFTPGGDELERARETLARFEAATQGGDGAVVGSDGRMLDEAAVRKAREVLASTHDRKETTRVQPLV